MVNRLMLAAASPQFCRDLSYPAGSFAVGQCRLALFIAQVMLSNIDDGTAMHLFVHLHAYLVKHVDDVFEFCHGGTWNVQLKLIDLSHIDATSYLESILEVDLIILSFKAHRSPIPEKQHFR